MIWLKTTTAAFVTFFGLQVATGLTNTHQGINS